jgi:surface-anchored protein
MTTIRNAFPWVLALTAAHAATPLALREHVDIHWTYEAGPGWTCEAKTEPYGEDVYQELSGVFLPLDDAPEESGGQRYQQPPGESHAFTGVAAGQPVWIASQIQQPGQCWPGFNNYQSDAFGSYHEADPRLDENSRNLPLPWIKLTLVGVTHHGPGTGAFSLWQEDSFGVPTVWFSTTDNTHPDTYPFEAGSHKHLNWGFGAPGIYRVRLSASAYLGANRTEPTGASEPFTVTFAVGPFAEWQAENFPAADLEDPMISGPDADPDHDGMKNLIEFAFGFDPQKGTLTPVSPGLGLPKLTLIEESGTFYEVLDYPRRRAGLQFFPLDYSPQFFRDPGWQAGGSTTTASDFPAGLDGLNPVWEKATSRRLVGAGGPTRGFARVGVSCGD